MKILPYDSWSLNIPLDPSILASGMDESIEPRRWLRGFFSRNHRPFQGTVSEEGFSISRIIHYRNAGLPILYGKFIQNPNGTTIRIRMMLHPFVLTFLGIWFGWLGYDLLTGMSSALENHSWGFLEPIGIMGGVALLIIYGGYFAEAGKSKRLISEIIMEVNKRAANNRFQGTLHKVSGPLNRDVVLIYIEKANGQS